MARRFIDEVDDALNYERESRLERDSHREPSQSARYLTREDYLERAAAVLGAAFVRETVTKGGGE